MEYITVPTSFKNLLIDFQSERGAETNGRLKL